MSILRPFVGRTRELEQLHAELKAQKPSLVIAYGRRRIGKSRLLIEAIADTPSIYFQATRVTSALNLSAFKAEIGNALGSDPILEGLSSWDGVLHYLSGKAADKHPRLGVIIDEFPYIVDEDPALPSIVQKFWDSGSPSKGNLKLILCGSAIAQMEELMAGKNPLYGRKTMSIDLKQLPLKDAIQFFPSYSPQEVLEAYAVFGGVPHYLQLCDPDLSLRENIIRLLLTETGALIDDPMATLTSELRDTSTYSSILAAIADGCTTHKDITGRLNMEGASLSPYYAKLDTLDLIERHRSLDADPKSRNQRFSISDPLMIFWHRYVRTHLSAISNGHGNDVYSSIIVPDFASYMGLAFERIARHFMMRSASSLLGVPASEVGAIWGHADYDIDVAGRALDNRFFYGECKWLNAPMDVGMLNRLIENSEKTAYGKGKSDKVYILFSRSGFKDDLIERANSDDRIHALTPEAMIDWMLEDNQNKEY